MRRIFIERGVDYFERKKDDPGPVAEPDASKEEAASDDKDDETQGPRQPMTTEELYKMRVELLPHLQ